MKSIRSRPLLLLALALVFVSTRFADAGSATWNLNPTSGDWNTASNWTPATVPNDPADVATLSRSNIVEVSMSATTSLDSLIFASDASPYTLAVGAGDLFTLWGAGVINNSGLMQTVLLPTIGDFDNARITFRNNATAGDQVSYVGTGGYISFLDKATAGAASFSVANGGSSQGQINFFGSSSAGSAQIALQPGTYISFGMASHADHAVIEIQAGAFGSFLGGKAGDAMVTIHGATAEAPTVPANVLLNFPEDLGTATFDAQASNATGPLGGIIYLEGATCSQAIFISEGSAFGRRSAGTTRVESNTDAGAATFIAHGGINGGEGGAIYFRTSASGGVARVLLDGNATMDISAHDSPGITLGVVRGQGSLYLGGNNLTLGANNQNATLAAVIQDGGKLHNTGGSLSKIGRGTLTLTGANLYTGGTTVSAGTLQVSNDTGSATGSGAVQVNHGSLGGNGTIDGQLTVGTGTSQGAFVEPGKGSNKAVNLAVKGGVTLQSGSEFFLRFNGSNTRTSQLLANGVTINQAFLGASAIAPNQIPAGTVFVVINNTSADPIEGTFSGLPEGSTISINNMNFQASYVGGDGNEFTLTAR